MGRQGYDPTDTEGLERAKAEEKAQKRVAQLKKEADFKWLMSDERGRRIVWGFLAEAGVFKSSFNTNSMQMAFNEGKRNYGLHTLTELHEICPELYPVMLEENTNDRSDGNADHSN